MQFVDTLVKSATGEWIKVHPPEEQNSADITEGPTKLLGDWVCQPIAEETQSAAATAEQTASCMAQSKDITEKDVELLGSLVAAAVDQSCQEVEYVQQLYDMRFQAAKAAQDALVENIEVVRFRESELTGRYCRVIARLARLKACEGCVERAA